MRILTQKQEQLLQRERVILNDLRKALAAYGAREEDQSALDDSILQLDDFFLLVVVGEFNAGKSAFINALLGRRVLREGVTPTTTRINILRYGEEETQNVQSKNILQLTAPVDLLEDISIVDTPGTNAVIREHEAITSRFIPRSDLVLFVTSADRPFTESERKFLEQIRDWGKKVLVVLNKIDILESPEDITEIQDFIRENARKYLGITPGVFPVSAQLALKAKQGQPQLWEPSRFEALETYLQDTLDETSRLVLKLENPLGVGKTLAARYANLFQERLRLLQEDIQMIDDIEAQLTMYENDMLETFQYRMADVTQVLLEMEQRGQDFFSEHLRLGRVFDLIRKERIQKAFEEEVIRDVPQQIERKVNALIDWMVDANLRQWQSVTEHLAERRQKHKDRMVGDIGTFQYDRERLIRIINREAREAVEQYDKSREAHQIAQGAQTAVAAAAALEVGAIGLGTLITILASTVTADVTGIVLASTLAALGFFVLPARRRKAKQEMRQKVTDMKKQLLEGLTTHFQAEIERSLHHIRETIAPYTRFIRAEREKNRAGVETFQEVDQSLTQLDLAIQEITDKN
jgi:small GTP-binding protein